MPKSMKDIEARQNAFLDAYLENPILSMKAHAERLGINVRTVYNWKDNNINGFADKLQERLSRKWEEAKQMASEQMFSLAREGDFKAVKYILDYHGYAPAQKVEAKVENKTVINVSIGDDEPTNGD